MANVPLMTGRGLGVDVGTWVGVIGIAVAAMTGIVDAVVAVAGRAEGPLVAGVFGDVGVSAAGWVVRLGSGVAVAVGRTEVDGGVGVLLSLTMACVASPGVAVPGAVPSAPPLAAKKMSPPIINNSSSPPTTQVIALLKPDRLGLGSDASCGSGVTTFSAGAGIFSSTTAA